MIRALLSLIYAMFLIKTRSLEEIYPLLKKRKLNCDGEWSIREADKALATMNRASRFFFNRVACLEESLALFLYATSQRKSVDWCVGVRLAPFVSHAWIEINGESILEQTEQYKKISVV